MNELVSVENSNFSIIRLGEERYFEDLQLIRIYLNQTDDSSQPAFSPRTKENYRRDLNRLMIFLSGEEVNLASVTLDHVDRFTSWLRNPPEGLIGTKRHPANHPEWRPFYKAGLSDVSIRQQFAAVKAFYTWLNNSGYINRNVFAMKRRSQPAKLKTERHLDPQDVQFITRFVSSYTGTNRKQARKMARFRWLWFAYVLSGLRISELIKLTTDDLVSENIKGRKVWYLNVVGKGRKHTEKLCIPQMFVDELHIYRNSLGLELNPVVAESLVLTITGNAGLTDRSSAHREFKALVNMAADHKEKELMSVSEQLGHDKLTLALRDLNKLREASVHWLRHSFVTTILDSSGDLAMVSSLARHKDVKTTMIYDHSELAAQSEVMNTYAAQFNVESD